jgi:nifR3 family TIM-barrel protein
MKIGNIDLGNRPLFLAPMEDITGPPFRVICKEMGADLCFSEFISSDGLIRDSWKSRQKLYVLNEEHPVAIQIFGNNVESVVKSAHIALESNPDIIDLNFGCPVNKVVNKGAGAALLNDLPKMKEIATAVIKSVDIPVTAKTRLGWNHDRINIDEVALMLQDCGISAITIHGRTRSMLYSGSADWAPIARVKNNPAISIPVIGNGDVNSPEIAEYNFNNYGVDAIMIGRAAIGNPWIFYHIKTYLKNKKIIEMPSVNERASVCLKHLEGEVKWKGEKRGIFEMRKHYSGYFKGLPYGKTFRNILVQIDNLEKLREILQLVIKKDTLLC